MHRLAALASKVLLGKRRPASCAFQCRSIANLAKLTAPWGRVGKKGHRLRAPRVLRRPEKNRINIRALLLVRWASSCSRYCSAVRNSTMLLVIARSSSYNGRKRVGKTGKGEAKWAETRRKADGMKRQRAIRKFE